MMINSSIDLPKNPRQVSLVLDETYKNYRGIGGLILRARPYICPFEEVLARIKPSDTVLDVGCGSGSFSMLLAQSKLATNIIGIDIAKQAIDVANKSQSLNNCQVVFKTMPPGEYPKSLFETVVCIDVLHHVKVPEQQNFIRNLCNKVEPKGQLLIKDISPLPRWKAAANTAHDIIMSNQLVNYRSEDLVAKWLQEEGMKIVESCRLDRLWYGHYLISAKKI